MKALRSSKEFKKDLRQADPLLLEYDSNRFGISELDVSQENQEISKNPEFQNSFKTARNSVNNWQNQVMTGASNQTHREDEYA